MDGAVDTLTFGRTLSVESQTKSANRRVNKFPHRIKRLCLGSTVVQAALLRSYQPHSSWFTSLSQSERNNFIETFFVSMLWFLFGSRTGHRLAWIFDIFNWTCGKTFKLPERQNKNKDKLVSFVQRRNKYHLRTITYRRASRHRNTTTSSIRSLATTRDRTRPDYTRPESTRRFCFCSIIYFILSLV